MPFLNKLVKSIQRMNKTIFSFFTAISTVLLCVFALHSYLQIKMNNEAFSNNLILNYCFNYLLTIIFFGVLIYYKERKSEQLGFIFLFSSLLKFILFFFFIYPDIQALNGMKNLGFVSFFVPYSICLFTEIYFLIKLLNK
jgi:hypothetical protein